jgi:hypothetical protein
LSVRAATEREDHCLSRFCGTAENRAQLVSFESTKRGFAVTLKEFRDAHGGGCFDAIVEVYESPGELSSEQRSNGSLARTHESGEAKNRWARSRSAA